MERDEAKEKLANFLRSKGKATNRELIDLLQGDRDLFERAREALILDGIAEDKKGVGLVYCGNTPAPAESQPLQSEPSLPPPNRKLHIFLSYGHDSHAQLAQRLLNDLKSRGHEVWFDCCYLRPGVDWENSIEAGLDWVAADPKSGFVILLMTPHSVRRPDGYCINEVTAAIDKHIPIVPVMLVEVAPPLSICRIQWLDLTDCIPFEQKAVCYERKLPMLISALENNSLDFEGVQTRIRQALRPLSYDEDTQYHLPRFTGRKWLLEKIDAWLADAHRSKVFLITGGPGSGKSAIAAWLCSHRMEIAAFHICKYLSKLKADPRQVVRSIAWQLSTQLPDYLQRLMEIPGLEDACETADAATLFDLLIVQPMHNLPVPGRAIVVLIDALDEATRFGRNELSQFLAAEMSRLPDWMLLILTSRPEVEVLRPLQELEPVVMMANSAENIRDVVEYIHTYIEPYAPGGKISKDVLETLLDKSEKNWLYIEWVRKELEGKRLSLSNPEAFPRGLGGMYSQFFDRKFSRVRSYRTRFRPLLDLIVAACEPLSMAEVSRLLGWTPDEARERSQAFGSLLSMSERGVRLFHQTVIDWLQDEARAGEYSVYPSEGHRVLAEKGWADYERGPDTLSNYMRCWLPVHLAAAQKQEELLRCVTDARFIYNAYVLGRHLDLAPFWSDARSADFQRRCDASFESCEQAGGAAERVYGTARGMGQLFQACGAFPKAIAYFEKALELASARGLASEVGSAHLDIGWCARHAEDFDSALFHVDRAIECFRGCDDKVRLARAESIKGMCLWHEQDEFAALEHLGLARSLCVELKDERGEAEALNHMGIVNRSLGQYERALEYLHQAEAFYLKTRDWRGLGKCCNSLGTAYWWSKQHTKALEYYQKADTYNAKTNQHYIAGLTANNLGYVYLELKEYRKSLDAFTRARSIRRELRTEGYEMMDVSGMAMASYRLGNVGEARSLSRQAIATLQRHPNVEDLVRAYYNHSLILEGGTPSERQEAGRALAMARELVVMRLERLEDPRVREDFIERVPLARELLARPGLPAAEETGQQAASAPP